jgi:Domain of unknown function (DUF4105)
MKKFVLFICLVQASLGFAQIQLSEKAEVSVITCGPWQGELYTAFGHSAFRIYDPVHGLDDAYNYGVFDFNQPHFYLNFAKGFLYYKLAIQSYPHFRDTYIYYNRSVHEQQLNLTQKQKQKLFDYLQWNALPENQHYRYDYFYDNCATRIRDVVIKVFGDSVQFDGSYIKTDYTIRELTDIYLKQQPWGDLGIDICLGLPMDKKASPQEYMFLPDYIESGFAHASILNNTKKVPLVKTNQVIYEHHTDEIDSLPHPLALFIPLAFLALLLTRNDIKKQRITFKWFDAILFGVAGAIGIVLLLLWIATDHQAAAKNYNLLWALPTHLVIAVALFYKKDWILYYFYFTIVVLMFTLLGWAFLPQKLNLTLLPIVITLLIRCVANVVIRRSAIQ